MKLNFTMSYSKPIVALGIIALCISGLRGQNIANFDQSQKNSSSDNTEGLSSSKNIVISGQNLTPEGLKNSGKDLLSYMHSLMAESNSETGIVWNPMNEPQSYQFDLSQNDLGDLYKLLELYKSETAKGNSIILIRKKESAGQMFDSIDIAKKYVVADDLSGFVQPTQNCADLINIVSSKVYNFNGSSQAVYIINSPALTNTTAAILEAKQEDLSGFVSLYPNPAQNIINVDLGQVQGNEITIFSMQGKLVKTIVSDLNNQMQKIDIADLPSGFYVMTISSPTGTAVKKFSKI